MSAGSPSTRRRSSSTSSRTPAAGSAVAPVDGGDCLPAVRRADGLRDQELRHRPRYHAKYPDLGASVAFSGSLSIDGEETTDFWNTVAAALAPGGKVIFIDDGPAAAAYEEVLTNQPTPAALRRLDDRSRYRIVRVFHDAQTLTALGWSVRIRSMAGNFIGIAEPPKSAGR